MSDIAPSTEAGVAEAVGAAHEEGAPLLIEGRGSKRGWLRPVQAARTLSTRNLTGITLYAPKELILAARAGTPLAEIEAAVAAEGQQIVAEPPARTSFAAPGEAAAPVQTIGGMVAANLSGPRRIAWGATRDHVMGVRAVNGAGETIHSGGRVLKNVTGLDLCKLLTGSHGTLAVLTEITLKVLPAPEASGTLLWRGLDAVRGVAALSQALGSPYGVSGAAFLPAPAAALLPGLGAGGSVALARIEDFAPSVAYRTAKLRDDMAAFGAADILEDAPSRALWRAVRDAEPLGAEPDEAVWRLSLRPSAGPAALAAAEAAGCHGFLDWGGGLVWLAGPADAATHAAVIAAATMTGGTWMLLRAPDALRTTLDVVPPEAPALAAISRAVKAAMDPRGILNPGRFRA